MKIKEIVQTTPNFKVLSEDEIERIYFDALGVIESEGARVKSRQALDLFENSQALITEGDLVRIPAVLVERALGEHPKKIALIGRTRKWYVRMQKDELSFGAGPVYPLAPTGDESAGGQSVYDQVYSAARIVDGLAHFDFITGPLDRSSENAASWNLSHVIAMLQATKKPLLLSSADADELYRLWQMGARVCGGEEELRLGPLFAEYLEIDAPLTLSATAAEKLLFCAEKLIPCVCASRAISGVTAPATIAGMLVQTLAETMLVSVLSYLQKPGMPLIRGGVMSMPHSSGQGCCFGAPEMSLSAAANTDVSKWLGLGMLYPAGITDAGSLGQDAGSDLTASLFYGFLSGADMIYGSGLINSGQTASLDAMVMCNEIIEMIKHIGKGISTGEKYLAVDLIESVGPGGEYLSQDHTYEHWQKWFRPRLGNRSTYDNWSAAGKKTMKDRAAEERRKILDEHQRTPLAREVVDDLHALAAVKD